MDQLPIEIIEKVLKHSKLTVGDILNFSSTCSYFRNVVTSSQTIWKEKIKQKWPTMIEILSQNKINYYEEIKYIFELKALALIALQTMPTRFYKKYELSDSDLEEWMFMVSANPRNKYYLVSYLREIVNTHADIQSIFVVPLTTPGNKTLQYYANKVLRFVIQLHLTNVWDNFVKLSPKQQILEKGAVFVAQWCQPQVDISYDVISEKLNNIAKLVRLRLYELNPKHNIFKTDESTFLIWQKNNLDCNQWNIPECREIINAMKEVIYYNLGFTGNNLAYYAPQNSFINEVLETKMGLPITMAIIFESVGRRLGLLFEPINYPNHFLLRFNESETEWYYIDIFNGGDIIKHDTCSYNKYAYQQKVFHVVNAIQVVQRMANNLELSARQHNQPNGRVTRLRSVLELLKLVSPKDIAAFVNVAKFYMLYNMNTKTLENYLMGQDFDSPKQVQRIVNMLRDYTNHRRQHENDLLNKVEIAQRTESLKYAVGMVMLHSTFNYKCVIYDWDPICLATIEWQNEMNVSKLRYRNEQPFYNVLVEDGSYRYVAQENLTPTTDTGFLHLNEDLGRHFSHFFHNHYVPNAEKDREYPADTNIRYNYYHEIQIAHYSRLLVP